MNTPNAIKNGDIDTIRERIQTREIHNGCKYNGLSALHLAIMYDQIEIAEILIQAGANINLPTNISSIYNIKSLYTPIHVAIQFNNFKAFVLLMQSGAILTNYDHHTETPLILAVRNNASKISSILVQKGAYNLANDKEMKTLLSLAIEYNNYKVIKALVYSGANTSYILEGGKSLLILAVERGNADVVELLINTKIDVDFHYDAIDGYRKNALYEAISHGYTEIVKKLIDADANVNLCVRSASTLKVGKNVITTGEKITLLSLAISQKLPVITKMLIEAGADFNNKFYDKDSLLDLAISSGDGDVIKIMLEHGVKKDTLDFVLKNRGTDWSEYIANLIEEITSIRLSNNDSILSKFTSYLASDKNNPLFSLPKEIVQEIVGYAVDNEITLNSQWCDNYIKYHPLIEVAPISITGEI